ncbi:unnamed protein product [Spirodela intermedia]|uniref:Uncharacterized protein n=2 Tax=Spirodela intermedia TaxID=51605 RepID=A0ABN7EEC3_SPIIN|nr:unnamed protein product [Spirodela intermedia]CAA7403218.1 unnamed protein product [Spirodela intermedia]
MSCHWARDTLACSWLRTADQILAATELKIVGLKITSTNIKTDIGMYVIRVSFRGRIEEIPYIMMESKVKLQNLIILEQTTPDILRRDGIIGGMLENGKVARIFKILGNMVKHYCDLV